MSGPDLYICWLKSYSWSLGVNKQQTNNNNQITTYIPKPFCRKTYIILQVCIWWPYFIPSAKYRSQMQVTFFRPVQDFEKTGVHTTKISIQRKTRDWHRLTLKMSEKWGDMHSPCTQPLDPTVHLQQWGSTLSPDRGSIFSPSNEHQIPLSPDRCAPSTDSITHCHKNLSATWLQHFSS